MISQCTAGSFQARLNRISSGNTTGWTEPGGGMADAGEGRKLTAAIQRKSTKVKKGRAGKFIWLVVFLGGGYLTYTTYGDQIYDVAVAVISDQLAG